ncbi:hypothetical protein ACLKMY_00575 [Paraburkholderia mimosarum]|uniref:hypothetical protein n=1 Tax=Paraburkholderia mimosarum TaxID=312026 RepID=UPI0039C4D776
MNCKPGDLAYITRNFCSENIGRVVEVIDAFGEYPEFGFCWNVASQEPLAAVNPHTDERLALTSGFIPDAWLRPISGVPVHDEQLDEMPA